MAAKHDSTPPQQTQGHIAPATVDIEQRKAHTRGVRLDVHRSLLKVTAIDFLRSSHLYCMIALMSRTNVYKLKFQYKETVDLWSTFR
jgi:hypothetical protein